MGEEARTDFRKLTTADAEVAAELDSKCFGREACNCEGAELDSDTAEIESLAVDPEYRRQGIATILLIKLLGAIKKRGATFIVLEVRPSNKAAIALYKSFGFQIVEREKDYYLDEDAWIMAKDFNDYV